MTSPSADQSALLAYLADNPEPCPNCDYRLNELTEPRCPECGNAIRLTIAAPTPKHLPWVSAVVWFAMGLGFDVVAATLWLTALGFSVLFGNQLLRAIQFLGPGMLVAAALVNIAGIIWLLRARRQWTRRTITVQWARSAGVFGAVLVGHMLTAALIMFLS